MKRLLFILGFVTVAVAGFAQTEDPTLKYSVETNSFWSNWFIQGNLAASAFYSNEEKGLGLSKSPLEGFRNNLGLSVAVGKWFTPGIGLRTKVNGFWGRTVMSDDKDENANKYWSANEQVLLNLSNLLLGYNENRVWNFIPYFGGGIQRNMSYNRYGIGLTAGLLNEFQLSKKLAVNVELAFGGYERDCDGIDEGGNKRGLSSYDRQIALELGLTYNLGSATWTKTPDVEAIKALSQSQIDALNAQLADAQAENDRLKNLLANQKPPETKIVEKIVTAPVSVFFNINKSKIASKKDLVAVQDLINAAGTDAKYVVTGYADSKTGSPDYNQKLSEKRANTVTDELVNRGVSRDNITVNAAGGVNDLSPVSYNRRATVKVE